MLINWRAPVTGTIFLSISAQGAQSLVYFVPQDENITVKLARLTSTVFKSESVNGLLSLSADQAGLTIPFAHKHIDRSQSLFYFVPQDENITVKLISTRFKSESVNGLLSLSQLTKQDSCYTSPMQCNRSAWLREAFKGFYHILKRSSN